MAPCEIYVYSLIPFCLCWSKGLRSGLIVVFSVSSGPVLYKNIAGNMSASPPILNHVVLWIAGWKPNGDSRNMVQKIKPNGVATDNTIARSVAPSENRIKFPPPILLIMYVQINIVPRTPHFELHPAPPKKHLNPNDQLKIYIYIIAKDIHIMNAENVKNLSYYIQDVQLRPIVRNHAASNSVKPQSHKNKS